MLSENIAGSARPAAIKAEHRVKQSEHRKRVRTALAAVTVLAFVLTAVWFADSRGGFVVGFVSTLLVTTLVSAVLAFEVMGLGTEEGLTRTGRIVGALGLALGTATAFGFAIVWVVPSLSRLEPIWSGWWLCLVVIAFQILVAVAFLAVARIAKHSDGRAIALAVLMGLYATLALAIIPASYLITGRAPIAGLAWLMVMVYGADIGAYYVGRRFGKRRLAPKISPNKTWAGFFGGISAASLVWLVPTLPLAMLGALGGLGSYEYGTELTPAWVILLIYFGIIIGLGALVGVLGTIGDLFASMFKRQAGAKDSGTLFPGHGGLLDRVDSLLPNLVLLPMIAFGAIFYF